MRLVRLPPIIAGVVLLLIVAAGGVWYLNQPQPPAAGYIRYSNPQLGFALDHPVGYRVEPDYGTFSGRNRYCLEDPAPCSTIGFIGLPGRGYTIVVKVSPATVPIATLADRAVKRYAGEQRLTPATIGGQPALLLQRDSDEAGGQIWVAHASRQYEIFVPYIPPTIPDLLKQVAGRFRFVSS